MSTENSTTATVESTPVRKSRKGHKMSPETRAKMSLARKGKKLSDVTKRKMSRAHKAAFLRKTNFSRASADAIRAEYSARKCPTNPTGEKVTYQSLAEKYHVSIAYVYAILQNKVWQSRTVAAAAEVQE